MAQFGAKYIKFNKIQSQPEDSLPVYENKPPVRLGALVKADLTVHTASGEIFGDDELAENMDEFSFGDLVVETVDMLDEVAAEVFGCQVEDKLVHYKHGDEPPEGGVAYYKVLMRQGKKVYEGICHPRAKAALGNDSAQTRGSNITFGTASTKFKVMTCNSGDWRLTEELATETEAKAWVDKMVAGPKADGGSAGDAGGGAGTENEPEG